MIHGRSERIRVFLLDDHEVVRSGLRTHLEAERDIAVVGEAGSLEQARVRIPPTRPHVALLDVQLPDGSGIDVCRELRTTMPSLACLMLTSFADDVALVRAAEAGARGYLLKQVRGNDIVGAVRAVAAGINLMTALLPEVAARRRTRPPHLDELSALSAQERRILELIGQGLTNRQIGEQLFLAEKTVKNYVSNLLLKLGMQRRTQAAAYVARLPQRG